MIGERVADWVLTGVLGQGSQGTVFEARHAQSTREAAVKLLPPQLARDPAKVDRFFDEARAAASVKHAGVVEVYDHGLDAAGRPFIAMERLRGETLFDRLRRGPMPLGEALAVLRQLAGALAATHESPSPVVHRDLKPENVFLVSEGDRGRVVVMDFGIARLSAPDRRATTLTGRGAFGTLPYMSPEQCRGEEVDHRTDLYALGCLLHEMASGVPPFGFSGDESLLRAHCDDPPPPLEERAEDVPPALSALAARLLAKRPDD